ncbi:MAG: Ig-like domain-containing protein, partial [Solirubrobacteraceae bacterium]
MLVTGCVGSASAAEAPTITIAQPLTGSSTNEQLPLFSGTTSDTLDPVTLDIYAGESATGTPLQTPTMLVPHELGPLQATWEITPETPLGQGQYTAVAEQADEGEAGRSSPVTFTIDTTPPKVSIDAVPSPSKDAEPTLSGDAGVEAGDESTIAVTVYRGSTVGGTVAASEDVTAVGASWSYTTPHLADGTYTAQASQSDEAGNIGTSAAVTFTVDTTPPAVSIHTLASPTKDQTPTLTGGAGVAPGDDAAVTVTIFKGKSATKVQSGSATVNGDEWSYTATHLADGNYTAQAEQSDDAGNVGKSATIAFTIDTTPPAVTINTVSSPTNNPEPTLTGAAGEAPGDDAAVSVTVYKGTVVGGTVINSGAATVTGATWSYKSSHLADGTYTAQAEQSDDVGNVGKSAAVTFTVDTTVPAVSISAVPTPTNDATPTLTGTASVATGDHPTVTVTIYEGVSVGGTVAASGGVPVSAGAWSYTTPHLADGTYTAQAAQSNEAGTVGTSDPVTFTIDTTPPAVSINPVSSPTNNATPTLTGGAGVAAGDDSDVTVVIHEGASVTGKVIVSGAAKVTGAGWSYASPHLADGPYTAQAEQSDDAGNLGKSAAATFTVDTTPPAVSIVAPAAFTNNTEPTLTGGAGTATGDDAAVTVTIYKGTAVGDTVAASGGATVSGANWSFKSAHLVEGTYTAQAEQSDDAGNIGRSAAVTFTVDTTPPVVSINALASPTNDSTPTLSGSAGTVLGDRPSVSVTVYEGTSVGGTVASTGTAPAIAGTWSYETAHLADGTYTAQASQSDEAGNTGVSTAVTFKVDTTPPVVSMNAPPKPLNTSEPAFSGDAGELEGDDTSVTVTIHEGPTVAGKLESSESVPVSGGTWSYKAPH